MCTSIRRTLGTCVIVFALSAIGGLPGSVHAQPQPPEFVPGELLLKFESGVPLRRMRAILASADADILRRYRLVPLLHLRLREGAVETAARALRQLPEVAYAEPNYYHEPTLLPNDLRAPELWGLHNVGQTGGTPDADIDAPAAWDVSTGDQGLVVAVLDSGTDVDHEDLAANLWVNPDEIPGNGADDDGNGFIDDVHGWDFGNDDNNPDDDISVCAGHGTHTAGTVGAKGNNGIGVTGVNWDVTIMPLKIFTRVLGVFCLTNDADIIAAIEYAADKGVRVSNNSYGGGGFNQAVFDAIQASDSVFVAAAGNNGGNNDTNPQFPASYDLDNVVSVAATDHNDALASFSNFGTASVDLGAPGVDILSTQPDDRYQLLSGTSMASPHVAGAVALQMAADVSLTNNEVRWRILNSVDPAGLPVATGGRLNAASALSLPGPAVTIDVEALGPTSVSPGDTLAYRVSLANNAVTSVTVDASVVAVFPDGREFVLQSDTLTLPGGAGGSQDFEATVPAGAAAGEYRLAGRAEVVSQSFDEDIVLYDVVP